MDHGAWGDDIIDLKLMGRKDVLFRLKIKG